MKIIDYLARVAKEPIVVNGERYPIGPVDLVTLDYSFFIKDDCQMCGKCCPNETTVWTESHDPRNGINLDGSVLYELIDRVENRVINVNGVDRKIYVSEADTSKAANTLSWPDRAEVERCHWLYEKDNKHLCKIHPVRSVTCGIPHIRFITRDSHTVIRTSQFGRNWRLKCPVTFELLRPDVDSTRSKCFWLKTLLDYAEDLGVNTFLPEIITYIQNGGMKPKNFHKETRPQLFKTGENYGAVKDTGKIQTETKTEKARGVSTLLRRKSE
jgi:Fe-S-cluster containining protein